MGPVKVQKKAATPVRVQPKRSAKKPVATTTSEATKTETKDDQKLTTEPKKKGSRKGKKAWRKNIDLTDVEAGIIALEKEQILYGAKVNKATDESLFTIETTGDPKVKIQAPKKQTNIDRILTKRSAMPANKATPLKRARVEDSKLEKEAMKALAFSENKKPEPVKFHDLWSSAAKPGPKRIENTKAILMKLPPSMTKKPVISDIELTHPGASYNPSKNDLEKLKRLRKTVLPRGPNLKQFQKAQRLVKVGNINADLTVNDMVTPIVDKPNTTEEDTTSEKFKMEIKKPLTKKELRKIKAKAYMEKRIKLKTFIPQVEQDIERLDEIAAEIKTKEEEQAIKTDTDRKRRKLKALLPKKKIGNRKVPLKNIAIGYKPKGQLSQIRSAGNLFREQYVGFQVRNMIDPIRGDRSFARKSLVKEVIKPEFRA